jgi:hypothetical protein
MAGFLFRLELEGGTPADPPTFETAFRLGALANDPAGSQELRVVGIRDEDADRPPVLVVEDVVQSGQTGTAA